MKCRLNGEDNPFDVTQWQNWAARELKKDRVIVEAHRPPLHNVPPTLLTCLTGKGVIVRAVSLPLPWSDRSGIQGMHWTLGWLIRLWSGKPFRSQVDTAQTKMKKKDLFAPIGLIHWRTTSREPWITQTVFAQLPGSHAHSNLGVYYTALLKECWHKLTKAKTWSLCNTVYWQRVPSPPYERGKHLRRERSLCGMACVCLWALSQQARNKMPYKGSKKNH